VRRKERGYAKTGKKSEKERTFRKPGQWEMVRRGVSKTTKKKGDNGGVLELDLLIQL